MLELSRRSRWRNADPFMLVTTLILLAFGLLTIYSADDYEINLTSTAFKQTLFVIVGLAVMVMLMSVDYRLLRSLVIPIYVGAVGLLVLVLTGAGHIIGGSKRWFNLGPFTFQPSQTAKLATIVALAAFIASRGPRMRGPLNYLLTIAIAALPAGLVFIEPDLGTSLVFVAIWAGMVAVSRTRTLYLLGSALAAIPGAWLAWHYVLQDYQKQRLLIFRHPDDDPLVHGYHIIQAKIMIGQAGLLGHRFTDRAWLNQFQELAVDESDFAFAHATGSFGFIGALALFVLFLLLIWRYLRVAHLARDEFGRLIAIGAASMLFFQAFVNIGMNVNLLPVVGIPLPFISAGGTPLVTLLALQGILQSVLMYREKLAFDPREAAPTPLGQLTAYGR